MNQIAGLTGNCKLNFLIIQGGGTAAHLMLDLWPSLQLEGWEIDEIVSYINYLSVIDFHLAFKTFFPLVIMIWLPG